MNQDLGFCLFLYSQEAQLATFLLFLFQSQIREFCLEKNQKEAHKS